MDSDQAMTEAVRKVDALEQQILQQEADVRTISRAVGTQQKLKKPENQLRNTNHKSKKGYSPPNYQLEY